jgi:hypothetical protein
MKEFKIPNKLVNVVKMTLEGSICRVKVQGSLSQYFTIRNGLRQGDPLSSVLCNIVLEKAVREIEIHPKFETTAKRLGLKINDKTEFMINTSREQSFPEAFEIGDYSFERTDSFKY